MIQSYNQSGRTPYHWDQSSGIPAVERSAASRGHSSSVVCVALPRPKTLPAGSLWQAVARRRSQRDFGPAPLSGEELFLLLWATQGITQPGRVPRRAAPSPGATYPLETYLAVNRVEGLAAGLYHWKLPDERLMLLVQDLTIGRQAAAACADQAMCAEAACVFFWTAVPARATTRYGEYAQRYICLEAGHVGQSLLLAATGLGLASCPVGALLDGEVNDLLGVDGTTESIVHAAVVGRPR